MFACASLQDLTADPVGDVNSTSNAEWQMGNAAIYPKAEIVLLGKDRFYPKFLHQAWWVMPAFQLLRTGVMPFDKIR